MNFKQTLNISDDLPEWIRVYPRLLILIKGSPDPDVLASSFALKLLWESRGGKAAVFCPQSLALPQNRLLVQKLQIPVEFAPYPETDGAWDGYSVLDHPSSFVEGISGKIPCILHLDHHQPADVKNDVVRRIICPQVGSVSTLVAWILKREKVDFSAPEWGRAATALWVGIDTDTDHFWHSTLIDRRAARFLLPYADEALLETLERLRQTRKSEKFLERARSAVVEDGGWIYSGVGYLHESERDFLALTADQLLRESRAEVVAVFGLVSLRSGLALHASLRTHDEPFPLDRLIRDIAPQGGARKYKGAFQVPLDFFSDFSDKEGLWAFVFQATLEKMKKMRERYRLVSKPKGWKKIMDRWLKG